MGDARKPRQEGDRERTILSVQWRGERLEGDTRAERRAVLIERLAATLQRHAAVSVDWSSLSLAAQTVQITVDKAYLERTLRALEADGLRVDAVVDRQVLD
jgi:hypothetical protein